MGILLKLKAIADLCFQFQQSRSMHFYFSALYNVKSNPFIYSDVKNVPSLYRKTLCCLIQTFLIKRSYKRSARHDRIVYLVL